MCAGLAVLGLYLFASESGYQSAVAQLCSVLGVLRDVAPPAPGKLAIQLGMAVKGGWDDSNVVILNCMPSGGRVR